MLDLDSNHETTVMTTTNGAGTMPIDVTVTDDYEQMLTELRAARRPIVVTHENPDGDALGSLIAMQGILSAIGSTARCTSTTVTCRCRRSTRSCRCRT